MSRRLVSATLAVSLVVSACVPRLAPIAGAPAAPATLPRTVIAPGHHQLVFNWTLDDREMSAKGDGVARIATPDSARLDFFLAGGFGNGAAILIGDSVQAPGSDMIRRLIPPPTLLWAALGRVALPNLPDTVIRVEGDVRRADIGRPVAWRLTFQGDTLRRVDRVSDGKVEEWVERSDATHIQYRNERARRSLQLTITRTKEVPEFDASTWRFVH